MLKLNIQKPSISCSQCSFGKFCLSKEAKISSIQYRLNRNEVLNAANDKFKSLYVIQKGALKTYEIDPRGNEIIQKLFLKNEVYGYEAIHKESYFFSASALSDTMVCKISYQQFLQLLHENPTLLRHSFELMSRQLQPVPYLKFLTARQKVAAFIMDLLTRLSVEKQSESGFLLPLSYQGIGNYLGLATETVSRIFSQFKKNHLLAIQNKHLYLIEIDKLKAIAEGFA